MSLLSAFQTRLRISIACLSFGTSAKKAESARWIWNRVRMRVCKCISHPHCEKNKICICKSMLFIHVFLFSLEDDIKMHFNIKESNMPHRFKRVSYNKSGYLKHDENCASTMYDYAIWFLFNFVQMHRWTLCAFVWMCVRVRVCAHSREVACARAYFFIRQKFDD